MAENRNADAREAPNWNLSTAQWDAVVRRAQAGPDSLADGAFVRPENSVKMESVEMEQAEMEQAEMEQAELVFFATTQNKPLGWGYPFLETIPLSRTRGAMIGRAWRDAAGLVQFEVVLLAAAQAIAADYESGASDLDFVTYEQAVELAVRGTPSDLAWLHGEFGRLAVLSIN